MPLLAPRAVCGRTGASASPSRTAYPAPTGHAIWVGGSMSITGTAILVVVVCTIAA